MKKIISLILAMALMLSVMPVLPAAAEETETTAAVETTAPTETVTVPAEEPAAPAEETTAPAEETTAPVEETTAPTEAATAPNEETTAPTEAVTVPTEETTAPAEETTAPAEETVPTEETGPETETVTTEADAETGMLAAQSETPEKIVAGESRTITLSKGEQASFTFTPQTTGKYVFYKSWRDDPVLDIWENGDHIGKSVKNDRYSGVYFTMEEGVEYTLTVSNDYRDAGVNGTVYFDVLQEAASFSLSYSSGSLLPGGSLGLEVTDIQPENAFVVDTDWTVSDESVAYVSHSGDTSVGLYVKKEGTVTVTATAGNGVSASYEVNIKAPEKIELGQSKTLTLGKGEQASFTFTPKTTGRYVFHMPYGEYNYEGGFRENFSLTIYKDGYVGSYVSNDSYTGQYCTMEASVEYTLIATNSDGDADITGTVYFDVLQEPASFSLHISSGSAYPGGSFRVSAENILPENAFVVDTDWTVSDESVASVSYSGHRYAYFDVIGEGTATITATAGNGVSASYEVNIKAPEKIELGQSKTLTLGKGETATFTFTPKTTGQYVFHMPRGEFHPEEQFSEDFGLVIYKDGEPIGEFVNNYQYSGEYCTMKKGEEYTLIATYPYNGNIDSITGIVTFDVLKEATAFTLIPSDGIFLGSSFHLYIMDLMPENAYALDVTWTVSDPNVVTKTDINGSNFGEFIVIGEGTATVTATARNGVSASYEVKIAAPETWEGLGSKTITLEGGETKYYRFVPKTSGKYVFTMPYTGADTEQLTVDVMKDGEYVGEYIFNDDRYGVYVEMEKGKEYILEVTNYYDQKLTDTVTLGNYVAPEKITLAFAEGFDNIYYQSEILHVGGDIFAEVNVSPEDSYAAGITLTSSDPSVLAFEGKDHYNYIFSAKKAGTVTVTATTPNGVVATKKITVRKGGALPILEGADSVVPADSSLSVRVDGEMDKLEEVWAAGKKLDAKDYTVTKAEKGIIITVSPEYLKTVKPGRYSLRMYFSNGWAATPFEIMTSIPGDINGDGKVAAIDAAMIYAAVNNKKVLTDAEAKAADVDGNGKIQAKDASMVYAYVNNKLDKFPVQK